MSVRVMPFEGVPPIGTSPRYPLPFTDFQPTYMPIEFPNCGTRIIFHVTAHGRNDDNTCTCILPATNYTRACTSKGTKNDPGSGIRTPTMLAIEDRERVLAIEDQLQANRAQPRSPPAVC